MLETITYRKNRIDIADYEYLRDIENRLVMAKFSILDIEVLEEILYSSLTLSVRDLMRRLAIGELQILPILGKLSHCGLLTVSSDVITVDKEMRKYYELQISKFDEDFKPGIEFLLGLLRNVPMNVLLTWYSIPRTSNNIFDSILEKYLLTPQIYQRYLSELNFGDPLLHGIMEMVFSDPQLEIEAESIIEKFGISHEQFEEAVLCLEFHFVCCLGYKKSEDVWKEVISPFYEWKQYLLFLKNSQPKALDLSMIQRKKSSDFFFIESINLLLKLTKKNPLHVSVEKEHYLASKEWMQELKNQEIDAADFHQIISKLILLKLATISEERLHALEGTQEWLEMSLENQAMFLYRHPLNQVSNHPSSERTMRDAEKALLRTLQCGWVEVEDFLKSVIVPLNDLQIISLKRIGKNWKYSLPSYTEEELSLFRSMVSTWLFETGITALGRHLGKECFYVTPFGQTLFES